MIFVGVPMKAMMILAMFTALPAMAQNRVCVSDDSGNPEVTIRVLGAGRRLDGIQVFRNGAMAIADRGPIFGNICHVNGIVYMGKNLSLGGCGSLAEPAREIVANRKTGEIYGDLTQMTCHFE